jgi:tRNA U34 2-thiouridine synthase MnmA/TrmU
MGLCFIGKRKFSRFISQYIPNNIGYIKLIETNEIIGEHYGLHRYTIGQRITPINKTYKSSKPLFIAKKDSIENIIYAVNKQNFQYYLLIILFCHFRHLVQIIQHYLQNHLIQIFHIGLMKYHYY